MMYSKLFLCTQTLHYLAKGKLVNSNKKKKKRNGLANYLIDDFAYKTHLRITESCGIELIRTSSSLRFIHVLLQDRQLFGKFLLSVIIIHYYTG